MSTPENITLSELLLRIKREVEGAFPLSCWVVGEVSEIKQNSYSGHCYMQLVEKGEKNGQPRAQASAVAWRSSWGAIAAHFRSATGGDVEVGMKLLLRVAVSFHELYGLSLVISDIDPSYTLGDLEAQRQRTIARLQHEGVFEMNRRVELPGLLQRLAVVSSRTAAGYQDFMRELDRSPYHFEPVLFEAFMQGDGAEGSIVAALDAIADRAEEFDAVVMIRGGGSQSDLACFNAYRLCSHVAQFPLPVITGIGHDKDRSVADMVAAVELKTPTAVAVFLVERMAQEDEFLASARERIVRFATGILDAEKRRQMRFGIEISRVITEMTRTMERRLGDLASALIHRKQALLVQRQARLNGFGTLLKDRTTWMLKNRQGELKILSSRIEAHDPARITALGFAIVRSEGRTIRSSLQLAPGQRIEITLGQGKIIAKTEKTK